MGDGIFRFSFYDAKDNYISVPLKQTQVDEYRDVLDLFSTEPLKKENKKDKKKGKKLSIRVSSPPLLRNTNGTCYRKRKRPVSLSRQGKLRGRRRSK